MLVPPLKMAKIIDTHKKTPSLSVRQITGTLGLKKSLVHKSLVNVREEKLNECGFAGWLFYVHEQDGK